MIAQGGEAGEGGLTDKVSGLWSPPAEYLRFHPTALEKTLREILDGPCKAWHQDQSCRPTEESPDDLALIHI